LCNAPGENSMPLELFRKFTPLEQNSGKLAVTLYNISLLLICKYN